MEWYSGDIAAAINESKTKKLIFLVYVYDPTVEDQIWNNETVVNICKENCISLKLESESQTCSFFKQIYPVTACPTTYLIGVNGKPIDTIVGNLPEDEFVSKLNKAVDAHNLDKESPAPVQKPSGEPTTSQVPDNEDKQISVDERVALAKEKLRKIQEKKKAEDEEKERNSEMERRRMGQEILKAKREKEDQELRQIAEEKRKEKLEDELAKKRILERIQQDREEKQKKYAQEKEEAQRTKEAERQKLEQQRLLEKQAEAARNSNTARLQFRFVDGSSINNQFDPMQTLGEVRDFVTKKLREMNESTSFSIHSTFPKREFTSSEMSMTLRDLNLAPSASLLIIPIKSKAAKTLGSFVPTSSSSSSSGSTSTVATYANDILSFIFLPITIIWGVLSSFFGVGQNRAGGSSQRSVPQTRGQQDSNSNLRRRNVEPGSSNVRNLNDLRDDDDKATWNGNSTQQM